MVAKKPANQQKVQKAKERVTRGVEALSIIELRQEHTCSKDVLSAFWNLRT
jgi:hypothetical protein